MEILIFGVKIFNLQFLTKSVLECVEGKVLEVAGIKVCVNLASFSFLFRYASVARNPLVGPNSPPNLYG